MDQAQKNSLVTAAFLLVVAAGVALYCLAVPKGRRQWRALDPKGRLLLAVCLVGWVSWVASAKVLRHWSAAIGLDGHWVLGVLPSFIAGVTVTAYAAFLLGVARRDSSLAAFFSGAVIMLLLELVQLWLPHRVFDPFDVLAGVLGAALISVILSRFASSAPAKVDA